MAKFCSLFSGSTGNCYYVGSSGRGVIIDAGVSCRTTVSALVSQKINLSAIDGILVTHEHTDHIKGLTPLIKHLKVPVYGSKAVIEYLDENDLIPYGTKMEIMNGKVAIGDLEIKPFLLSHDCVCNTGFQIHTADHCAIGFATDLGYVSNTAMQHLKGCDLVVLESNYDEKMMENSGYPAMLKKRIMGKTGHLSNDQCSEALSKLCKTGSTRFLLAHLSKENNRPSVAYGTAKAALEKSGLHEGKDFTIYIANANSPSEMIIL